jgi:lipoprotein-anchoring transpeptidase ErfK/SrfK
MPLSLFLLVFFLLLGASPLRAETGSQETIDLQVRLSRAHASPGPIDGMMGKNTRNAINAFQRMHGLEPTGERDEETAAKLGSLGNEPTMLDYEITEEDVKGPFLDKIPNKMTEMAKLERLSYTSPLELLAEKFHMDQDLLQSLNPDASFDSAGTTIRVTDLADLSLETAVKRVEVDRERHTVDAYDKADKLVAVYPASIGSDETPSPEGEHEITGIAKEPSYTYNPEKLDFEGIDTDKEFTIAPGPNNPVGLVWIALNAPSYGLHGSPEPEKIRRQQSHGCVRLTNWDALALARVLKPGIPVAFVQGQNAGESEDESN